MTPTTTRPDLLAAIVGATRRIVETRRELVPVAVLERQAAARTPKAEAFRVALRQPGHVNVIAECKRRSPSRGVLRQDYNPQAIAEGYARAGAAALSVLTEPTFFDGSLAHLAAVRSAVSIPLLRKDFIVDEYQMLEASAAGADAVLLIVAALDAGELKQLSRAAAEQGLATLVEVHDVIELERALAAGADVIGVNNRNLRTLEVDVTASREIAARLPAHVTAVSESGLKTAADVHGLQALGYHAFLIGERFMTAVDPGAALADLLASAVARTEGTPLGAPAGGPKGPPLPKKDGKTQDESGLFDEGGATPSDERGANSSGRGGALAPPASSRPSTRSS